MREPVRTRTSSALASSRLMHRRLRPRASSPESGGPPPRSLPGGLALALSQMAALDSEAYFESRCAAVGLAADHVAQMRTRGWTTMANFAFSSAYAPGQADDSKFIEGVILLVLGAADSPQSVALRRLFFECYTMSVAEMRRKLERTDENPPVGCPWRRRRPG